MPKPFRWLMRLTVLFTLMWLCVGIASAQTATYEPITVENAAQIVPFTLLVGRFGSFSADGSQLSTIVRLRHEDYSVHVWSAETFEEKAILEHSDFVDAAKLSPDGTRVATVGKDGKIRLWNPATSSLELELPGAAVAFSPDGTLLAVGSCEDSIKLLEVASGSERAALGHSGCADRLIFNADGTLLAAGDRTQSESGLWNLATGEEIAQISGIPLAFSADGSALMTADNRESIIYLWNTSDGTALAKFASFPIGSASTEVALTPGGTGVIYAAKQGTLSRWNISAAASEPLKGDLCPTDEAELVAFSTDGALAAIGCLDGTVRLRDAALENELAVLPGFSGFVAFGSVDAPVLAFSPDNSTLVVSGDETTLVYRVAGVDTLTPKPGHWESFGGDATVAFDVQQDGTIANFDLAIKVGTGSCSIKADSIALSDSRFFIEVSESDPTTVGGKLVNSTAMIGALSKILFGCRTEFMSAPIWNALWQSDAP